MEFVVGVDGHQDAADLGGGEHEGEPFRDVPGPDAHVVPPLDADGQQALGQLLAALIELPVGPAEIPVGIEDEGMVGLGSHQVVQKLPNGLFRKELCVVNAHGCAPVSGEFAAYTYTGLTSGCR